MNITMRTPAALAAAILLVLLVGAPAMADDAAASEEPIFYLGKLPITGQQHIVDTLLAIKVALHEPVSDDPAAAGKVVCRINRETGTAMEFLDCATNRDLAVRHEHVQEEMLARRNGLPTGGYGEALQQDFDGLIASQPNHRLHVPVKGAALLSILNSLPDDAKVVAQDDAQQ